MDKNKWEFKSHSHQIADTGDYDGYYEISNGDITLVTRDDFEDAERQLKTAVAALNRWGIKFYDQKVEDLSIDIYCLKDAQKWKDEEFAALQSKVERYDELYRLCFSNLAKLRARCQDNERMVSMGDNIRSIIEEVTNAMLEMPQPEPAGDGPYLVQSANEALNAETETTVPVIEQGAVWLTGQYDRLYEQLKADPKKRIACFVDYSGFGSKSIHRDICTIRGERLEFVSRGHGYGGADCLLLGEDEKTVFLAECERLHVQWLDESAGEKEDWISVDERLPEESGRYWCYVKETNSLGKSHFQWNCFYHDKEKRWSDDFVSMNVTHWRPLPSPPKTRL